MALATWRSQHATSERSSMLRENSISSGMATGINSAPYARAGASSV